MVIFTADFWQICQDTLRRSSVSYFQLLLGPCCMESLRPCVNPRKCQCCRNANLVSNIYFPRLILRRPGSVTISGFRRGFRHPDPMMVWFGTAPVLRASAVYVF